MDDPQSAAVERLQILDERDTFVALVGGADGLDCFLETGTHEPTGVHLHLLGVHIKSLAREMETDYETVAQAGLDAAAKIDRSSANEVALEFEEGNHER